MYIYFDILFQYVLRYCAYKYAGTGTRALQIYLDLRVL